MSEIRAVTVCDEQGNVHTTLSLPREVLTRLAEREVKDEQDGAKYRDRLLQALASMVIQSIDEFRTTDIFSKGATSNGKSTD